MPGKHLPDLAADGQICRRCRTNSAVLVVRTELLCKDCFIKYVHTKAIKRMESFRVRNAAPDTSRKLLVPVSFGVSSITLLHILDHHLQSQKVRTGRTGFTLKVVFIDTSLIDRKFVGSDKLPELETQYLDHTFASIPLSDVFENRSHTDSKLQELAEPPFNDYADTDLDPQDRLDKLISSLPSATARADVISTLRTRLIIKYAREQECEGILWGDSTTRLAERTLAETAKGRGFSLPWQLTDGTSPHGLTFNYPLRDLLKKELVAYIEIARPELKPLVVPTAATQSSMSSKNTTIDDLMKQYFESVEENFPSIVANVVRTTSKLEAMPLAESAARCRLCKMPVPGDEFGIHGWSGNQQENREALPESMREDLCYGCTRSMPPV